MSELERKMLMEKTVTEICGDDHALCESIMALVKKLDCSDTQVTVGSMLWDKLLAEYDAGNVKQIFGQAGLVIIVGTGADATSFHLYERNSKRIVMVDSAVGDYLNYRVRINVRKFHIRYINAHKNYQVDDINKHAMRVLLFSKDALVGMVDEALRDKIKLNDQVDKLLSAYGTESSAVSPEPAPQAIPEQIA